jgi:hypothetical protein
MQMKLTPTCPTCPDLPRSADQLLLSHGGLQCSVVDPCRPGPEVPVTVGSLYGERVYLLGKPRLQLSELVSTSRLPVAEYTAMVECFRKQACQILPYLVRGACSPRGPRLPSRLVDASDQAFALSATVCPTKPPSLPPTPPGGVRKRPTGRQTGLHAGLQDCAVGLEHAAVARLEQPRRAVPAANRL